MPFAIDLAHTNIPEIDAIRDAVMAANACQRRVAEGYDVTMVEWNVCTERIAEAADEAAQAFRMRIDSYLMGQEGGAA